MSNFIIALDGPAGSGKSSISKRIADRFGFTHIDTGAMYRAITLEALRRKIDINNEEEYTFLNDTKVIYSKNKVYLNGSDVSKEIRTEKVISETLEAKLKECIQKYVEEFKKTQKEEKISA